MTRRANGWRFTPRKRTRRSIDAATQGIRIEGAGSRFPHHSGGHGSVLRCAVVDAILAQSGEQPPGDSAASVGVAAVRPVLAGANYDRLFREPGGDPGVWLRGGAQSDCRAFPDSAAGHVAIDSSPEFSAGSDGGDG